MYVHTTRCKIDDRSPNHSFTDGLELAEDIESLIAISITLWSAPPAFAGNTYDA